MHRMLTPFLFKLPSIILSAIICFFIADSTTAQSLNCQTTAKGITEALSPANENQQPAKPVKFKTRGSPSEKDLIALLYKYLSKNS